MKLILLTLSTLLSSSIIFAQCFTSYTIPEKKETRKERKKQEESNIVNTIPSPNSSTDDITFDGKNLWVGTASGYIYQVAPANGEILKEFKVASQYAYGLCFDGESLWLAERDNHRIVKMDTSDGSILKVLEFPSYLSLNGLAWVNGNLWMNNNEEASAIGDTTFIISPETGDIIERFIPNGEQPTGLTYDGKYIWTSDNKKDEIYKLDPRTHEVLETIPAPGGEFPNGLAFDGQYLWVSNNESDELYQIDIGFEPVVERQKLIAELIPIPLIEVPVPEIEVEEEQILEVVSPAIAELRIYPNPVSDILHFTSNLEGTFEIEIYNSLGELVYKGERVQNRINTSRFVTGVYLLRAKSGEQVFTKRFIKH